VAHGDESGVVKLDSILSAQTISRFDFQLSRLRSFLTADSRLIFFSCIAGSGEAGSALLNALSTRLRGCTVIGFEVSGRVGSAGILSKPGQVTADTSTPGLLPNPVVANTSGTKTLDEYSWFSKWSKDGRVIRIGMLEQGRPGRNNRCASPKCPGHRHAYERCDSFR